MANQNVLTGTPIGLIGAGIAYLDGATDAMIKPYWMKYWNDWLNKRRVPLSCDRIDAQTI